MHHHVPKPAVQIKQTTFRGMPSITASVRIASPILSVWPVTWHAQHFWALLGQCFSSPLFICMHTCDGICIRRDLFQIVWRLLIAGYNAAIVMGFHFSFVIKMAFTIKGKAAHNFNIMLLNSMLNWMIARWHGHPSIISLKFKRQMRWETGTEGICLRTCHWTIWEQEK